LEKFYLIGLGGRGQTALKRFGVWEAVQNKSVALVGRRDWPPNDLDGPGVEEVFAKTEKTVTTYVLPRDKLVGILQQEIVQHYRDRIVLHYGYEVQPLDFVYQDGKQVLLQVSQCNQTVSTLNYSQVKTSTQETVESDFLCDVETNPTSVVATNLLIAADGTVRTIANAMQAIDEERLANMTLLERFLAPPPFSVTRYPDDNQRIYKTIPFQLPTDWRSDLDYSARSQDGRVVFDALPANARGSYCGVVLLQTTDPLATSDTDPGELRRLLDDYLPRFSELIDEETVVTVAQKPVSYLPGFRYAGPRLHQGNRCVLLGDCAHTVKPYFGGWVT
jgi:2-polyprenyl-6-methoxyphenol hydroxylase-like FAD-dependent oxidoreductase